MARCVLLKHTSKRRLCSKNVSKNIIFPSVIPIVYAVGLFSWTIYLSLLLLDVKKYFISKLSGLAGDTLTLQHPSAEPAGPLLLQVYPIHLNASQERKVQAGKQLFLKGSKVPLIQQLYFHFESKQHLQSPVAYVDAPGCVLLEAEQPNITSQQPAAPRA